MTTFLVAKLLEPMQFLKNIHMVIEEYQEKGTSFEIFSIYQVSIFQSAADSVEMLK